jgi:hypothetical protein
MALNEKLKLSKVFFLLFIICCLLKITSAANCSSLIQNTINYLNTRDPGYTRYVSFYMSTLKDPTIYVGYSVGSFQVKSYKNSKNATVYYLYAKDFKTTFSDRTWCPNLPKGGLCLGYQEFDYRRADLAQLYLYTSSTGVIVFSAWKNAAYSFTL